MISITHSKRDIEVENNQIVAIKVNFPERTVHRFVSIKTTLKHSSIKILKIDLGMTCKKA